MEIIDDQAEVVRLIFDWYVHENMTPYFIAVRLNEMGIPGPRKNKWVKDTVRKMLENRHYIGQVTFNKIKTTPVLENGEVITKKLTQPEEDIIIAEGKHPAIISMDLWNGARSRIAQNPRNNVGADLKNPLAGILRCSACGRAMYIHPYSHAVDRYECRTRPKCFKTVRMDEMQAAVLHALERSSLPDLQARVQNDDGNARKIQQRLLEKLEAQMEEYRDQEEQQYDLLETRVYTQDVFDRRNAKLRAKMEECQVAIYKARATLPENVDYAERVVSLQTAIEAMKNQTLTPAEQNRLLKVIVERIEFTGQERVDYAHRKGVKQNGSTFTLEVFLRL